MINYNFSPNLVEMKNCFTIAMKGIASVISPGTVESICWVREFYYEEGNNKLSDFDNLLFRMIDNVTTEYYINRLQLLGINIQWNDSNLIYDAQKAMLSNVPFLILTDVYDCPWNDMYHVNKFNHFILLGDFVDNRFLVYDPMFKKDPFWIDTQTLIKLTRRYSIPQTCKYTTVGFTELLKYDLKNSNKNVPSNGARRFAEDVSINVDILSERLNNCNINTLKTISFLFKVLKDDACLYNDFLKVNISDGKNPLNGLIDVQNGISYQYNKVHFDILKLLCCKFERRTVLLMEICNSLFTLSKLKEEFVRICEDNKII